MPSVDREDTIKLIAALVCGLQVPVSLFDNPRAILGAAYNPWSTLKNELGGFGWVSPEDVEEKLREMLETPR